MTSGSLADQGIGMQPAGMGAREPGRKEGRTVLRLGRAPLEPPGRGLHRRVADPEQGGQPAAPGLDRKHDLVPGLEAAISRSVRRPHHGTGTLRHPLERRAKRHGCFGIGRASPEEPRSRTRNRRHGSQIWDRPARAAKGTPSREYRDLRDPAPSALWIGRRATLPDQGSGRTDPARRV